MECEFVAGLMDEYVFRADSRSPYESSDFYCFGISEESQTLSIKCNFGYFAHTFSSLDSDLAFRPYLLSLGAKEIIETMAQDARNVQLHPTISLLSLKANIRDMANACYKDGALDEESYDKIRHSLLTEETLLKFSRGQVILCPDNEVVAKFVNSYPNKDFIFLRYMRPRVFHLLTTMTSKFLDTLRQEL